MFVIALDKVRKIIYLENNPDQTYSPLTPTYVQQTVYFIKNYIIDKPGTRIIGRSKIGGASIPKNVYIEAKLTNTSNTDGHVIVGHSEYLY